MIVVVIVVVITSAVVVTIAVVAAVVAIIVVVVVVFAVVLIGMVAVSVRAVRAWGEFIYSVPVVIHVGGLCDERSECGGGGGWVRVG